jgi:signal transduction histidine kinase/DNA-binding response OmpR family regulator
MAQQTDLQLILNGSMTLFGGLMARSFLESKRRVPRLDWLLIAVAASAPLPWLAHQVLSGKPALLIRLGQPVLTSLILMGVGLAVLRTGYRPARYYMAGWTAVVLSIIVFNLTHLNVLPVNWWTINGSVIAWEFEMAILSFGLANRFNMARQAQQQAQSLALMRLREKEVLQETANHQLAKRAAELEDAYEELHHSLANAEQLKSMDELKTNFFTNISHEFRTPLTLILGPAEALVADSPDLSTRRQGSLILRNAQRLLRLINQLLDLSKLDAGAMQLTPAQTDVAMLARQQAATFASLAEARSVRFRTDGPVQLPFVVDAPKLETILANLLSNALRFTPTGGEVVLSWRELPNGSLPAGIELTVADTGPGIGAGHLAHLFDRFYQGAHPTTPGAQPGTGVGLTLVKELTELHNGTVTVRSPPGYGATFVVRLPHGLVPVPADAEGLPLLDLANHEPLTFFDAAEPAAMLTDEADEVNPAADLVLFIEDNADVREYIRTSLAPAGYRLLEASDGLAGVALAREHVPDLVISDVMMPGLDGYEVVRQLKAEVATSHVPVVLLTAKSGGNDRLTGLETGADAYLGKPFAARELRAQVRNLLALRARTRAQALGTTLGSTPGAAAEPVPETGRLSALDEQFLARVTAAVEQNLAESAFDVDQLSRDVALSRTQLQRKLRALTGQAPAEYIRLARLQRAMELLQAGAGSVSEVGYEVGFSSPAHFSTVFSRHFGFPPSETVRL